MSLTYEVPLVCQFFFRFPFEMIFLRLLVAIACSIHLSLGIWCFCSQSDKVWRLFGCDFAGNKSVFERSYRCDRAGYCTGSRCCTLSSTTDRVSFCLSKGEVCGVGVPTEFHRRICHCDSDLCNEEDLVIGTEEFGSGEE